MKRFRNKNSVWNGLMILTGTGLMAAAVNCVFEPMHLVTGGVTGIGIMIKEMTRNIVSVEGIPLWVTNLVCNSVKYESAYWKDIKSQIIVDGTDAYYIKNENDEGGIYSRSITNDTEKSVKESLGRWDEWGDTGRFWRGAYSGLFFQDGRLYYNTSEKIWSISLDGSNDIPVSDGLNTEDGYIYGSRRRGGQIEYLLSRSPNKDTPDIKKSTPFPAVIPPTKILL